MQRKHSPELKMKVALEALKGQMTTSEIASRYQVHPCQVSQWKRQALEGLPQVFGQDHGRATQEQEELTDRLYQEIGRLKVELEWLRKKGVSFPLSRNGR